VGIASGNKATQAGGGCVGAAAFIVAARLVAALRRVKAAQPVNHTLEAHGVTIDHFDRAGLVNFGPDD
jgi:hypothetical protein